MATASANDVTAADVERARLAGQDVVRHTPVLPSATLSETSGGEVVLKAESLQRTGAFKLRGALAKMAALGDACASGVVAASAGNHAQALAAAARARSVPCEVFMPTDSSIGKAEGAQALGATVRLVGTSVEECMDAARDRAREAGLTFVHPFDDPDVIAGQGTVGLELLEDVPDLAKVIVPVGGGGLASGTAIAVKSAKPDVEVVGVQVEAFAPFPESMRTGEPVTVPPSLTIADGIAVKRPGEITLPLIREWVDDVVTVGEDDVAEAMVMLLEKAKLVVEGAGAVGVAALLAGKTAAAPSGPTVVVLSGGNVDAGLLAMVARRHETEAGRRLVILTRIQDRPGAMASLLACVGGTGANLLDVQHVREALDLHVRETAVQLVLETRGPEHAAQVLKAMTDEGYEARTLQ
jgi:threonine dehydratase